MRPMMTRLGPSRQQFAGSGLAGESGQEPLRRGSVVDRLDAKPQRGRRSGRSPRKLAHAELSGSTTWCRPQKPRICWLMGSLLLVDHRQTPPRSEQPPRAIPLPVAEPFPPATTPSSMSAEASRCVQDALLNLPRTREG